MLFTNKGGHGTQFGSEALEISSDEDIPQLWAKHMQMKPFVTKAVIESFGGHGTTLTDSQLKALGDRSKAAGLPYFVHVSTLEDGKRAIRAGATALAHGISSEAIDDEFIQLMKANNVAYIPTLAVMLNHSGEKESQAVSRETQLLEVAPEKLKRCLFTNVPTPSKWLNDIWNKRHHAFDNIKKLHQAGVSIGTGSDAGNPYTLHGTGLHNEFLLLSEAGLSNQEIMDKVRIAYQQGRFKQKI